MTVWYFTPVLTVPAKTAPPALFSQALALQDGILDTMTLKIPSGHAGLTGVAVFSGGVQLWPSQQGTFVIGDNETVTWDYGREIGGAGLLVAGFNNDIFPHSFYFRFAISDKQAATPVTIESAQDSRPVQPQVAGTIAQLAGAVTAGQLAAAMTAGQPSFADLAGVQQP